MLQLPVLLYTRRKSNHRSAQGFIFPEMRFQPMLLSRRAESFERPGWLFEIKLFPGLCGIGSQPIPTLCRAAAQGSEQWTRLGTENRSAKFWLSVSVCLTYVMDRHSLGD